MPSPIALIDAGPLIAVYNKGDRYHKQVWDFLQTCTQLLLTTDSCTAEALNALRLSSQVQSDFSQDIAEGIWQREVLQERDFQRIAELFNQYRDLPADFADLSLVAILERLDIPQIVTLDKDFDVYRRYRDKPQPFERIFSPRSSQQ